MAARNKMAARMLWSAVVVATALGVSGQLNLFPQPEFPRNEAVFQPGRVCSHVPPKPDEVIHGVVLETRRARRSRDDPLPRMRIRLTYDHSVFRLTPSQFRVINDTVLPQAVAYWESALSVLRQTTSPVRLNRKCEGNKVVYRQNDPWQYCEKGCESRTMCGEVVVPDDHLEACRVCGGGADGRRCGEAPDAGRRGNGVDAADFVLYISAEETPRCHKGLTVAYAAHCQQEMSTDRPVAGHANLCPSSISTGAQELDTLLSTVKHEMLHALGFSLSLYAFYRAPDGTPLSARGVHGRPELDPDLQAGRWSERVIRKVTRRDWKVRNGSVTREIHMMVTPTVVREVRGHFGCEMLEGAELEDQGDEGTALTHWEKRVFENEAMTGTHTQNPVYSRVTLALMEDTGWYKANYSLAQPLEWGKNLGCDFVLKSCKDWMDARREIGATLHPFCEKVKRDPLETECSEDRSSVALCNLIKHPVELAKRYQNFDEILGLRSADNAVQDDHRETSTAAGQYGGSVVLADYCPYVQEFTWRANSVALRGSHCLYKENHPPEDKNFALEEYGQGAKCFRHSRQMWEERSCQQRRQWQHWGSGCYKFHCGGEHGTLQVLLSGRDFPCFYPGQLLKVQLYQYGWLHRGAILCPQCRELCPRDQCWGEKNVPFHVEWDYPKDSLPCKATVARFNLVLYIGVVVLGAILGR